jgi:hypothetical protein
MNAFEHLFPKDSTKSIFKNINRWVDVITLNYSKGETEMVTVLFTNKAELTFDQAMSLLVMRYKMYSEEWNDIERYTSKDIKLWSSFIKAEYGQSTFESDISFEDFRYNFFVNRLFENNEKCSIKHKDRLISDEEFQILNPLIGQAIKINRVVFDRMEEEFFVETDKHFVMFNWYTTA